MGYTPIFDTVFEGSLCGKYPDTAVWLYMLALADWRGEVDKTPEFISALTGMPLGDLKAGISNLSSPDPRSRSHAEEGRRLIPIDDHRDWGWKIVNIQKYRDKASGIDQVKDGRNAAKVRRHKEGHRRTPADTGETTGTPTHTHTQTREESVPPPEGLDIKAWAEWEAYRKSIKKPISLASRIRAQEQMAKLGDRQSEAVAHSIANGWTGLFAPDKKIESKGDSSGYFKFSN
jgi:hypothetical protein